jgi:hypothetical protein
MMRTLLILKRRPLRTMPALWLVAIGLAIVDPPLAAMAGPENLTIYAAAANAIEATLNAGTNVVIETTATGASGLGTKSAGPGDIVVAASLTWTGNASLILSAYRNVTILGGRTIASNGKGGLLLRADSSGDGTGTVSFIGTAKVNFAASTGTISILYNPSSYAAPTDYAVHVTTNGGVADQLTAYMLVNTVSRLQEVDTNLAGDYALGRDIDASSIPNFTPIGNASTPFTGELNGENESIAKLTIGDAIDANVGLFGDLGSHAVVRNLKLVDVDVSGSINVANIGALAGESFGTVSNASVTGSVSASGQYDNVGGLIGSNGNTLTDCTSAATVTGGGNGNDTGGLVGVSYDDGLIFRSSATGNVSVGSYIGGLAGVNNYSTIRQSFATGKVTDGGSGDIVGGLVGANIYTGSHIIESYATGAVAGGAASHVGGLAGYNNDPITQTYATGKVTGGTSGKVGGLIGTTGSGAGATASYWDTQTTHQPASAEGTARTTAQLQSGALPAGFDSSIWGAKAGFFPYLLWQGAP